MALPIAIAIFVDSGPLFTKDVTLLALEDRRLQSNSTEFHKYAPQFSAHSHFKAHHNSFFLEVNLERTVKHNKQNLEL